MTETEYSQKNLAAIRTRLDQIESMQRLLTASSKEVREHVRSVLTSRDNAAEVVLLLADGPLVQEEIVRKLGKSQPTVSRVLTHLWECGLLVRYGSPENPRVQKWGLNDLETTVNVSRIAKTVVAGRPTAPNRRGGNGSTPIQNR